MLSPGTRLSPAGITTDVISFVTQVAAHAGDNVLVLITWSGTGTAAIVDVTDGLGNSYSRIRQDGGSEVWYATLGADVPLGTTVTADVVGGTVTHAAVTGLVTGNLAPTTPIDVAAAAAQTATTSPSSGAVTPSAATDIVVGHLALDSNAAATVSGWDGSTTASPGAALRQVVAWKAITDTSAVSMDATLGSAADTETQVLALTQAPPVTLLTASDSGAMSEASSLAISLFATDSAAVSEARGSELPAATDALVLAEASSRWFHGHIDPLPAVMQAGIVAPTVSIVTPTAKSASDSAAFSESAVLNVTAHPVGNARQRALDIDPSAVLITGRAPR